jgi:hypothetical protein
MPKRRKRLSEVMLFLIILAIPIEQPAKYKCLDWRPKPLLHVTPWPGLLRFKARKIEARQPFLSDFGILVLYVH